MIRRAAAAALVVTVLLTGEARSIGQDPTSQGRQVFALEIAGFRFVEPEIELTAAKPDRLVFHLLDPVASAIPTGRIRTTINGEPAGTIHVITRTATGRGVVCDLKQWPRFALQPGRNVLSIRVEGEPHEASYVVFLKTPSPSTAVPPVAYERRRVPAGADTEPVSLDVQPLPERTASAGPATVTVQGVADDNRGVLAVTINGSPASLKPSSRARASAGAMEFSAEVPVAPGSTQVAVEALDRAGNVSRALLRVRAPSAALASPGLTGRRAAVIAGVSKYARPEDGLGNLAFASRDAQAVHDLLTDARGPAWPRTSIELLLDQQATRAGLRDAISRAAAGLRTDDVLFLYIAAHGTADPYEKRAAAPLYLLMHDTRLSDLPRTGLPMAELQDFLRATVAARIVALIDVCHSAGILGEREASLRSSPEPFGAMLAGRSGMAVMASSAVGEVSRERPDLEGGHGVFTYAVLRALRGAADANRDGTITAAELFASITTLVRELTGGQQNPQALPGTRPDLPIVRVAVRPGSGGS